MRLIVTKLHQAFIPDGRGGTRTVVLKPGDRIDGLRDAGPAGPIPVQEVSDLKKLLGPMYDELVSAGIIREEES